MNSKLLLTIDDELVNRSLIIDIAQQAGFSCIEADCPEKIRAGLALRPDVIILDMTMPEMDGIEVLQEMAKNYSNVPIIISSGFDSRIINCACVYAKKKGLNLVGRLDKPIDPKAFIGLLNSAITSPAPLGERNLECSI